MVGAALLHRGYHATRDRRGDHCGWCRRDEAVALLDVALDLDEGLHGWWATRLGDQIDGSCFGAQGGPRWVVLEAADQSGEADGDVGPGLVGQDAVGCVGAHADGEQGDTVGEPVAEVVAPGVGLHPPPAPTGYGSARVRSRREIVWTSSRIQLSSVLICRFMVSPIVG